MSDIIDQSLLQGETVLWRGRPDFDSADERPKPWRQRRQVHMAWIVALVLVSAVLFAANFAYEGGAGGWFAAFVFAGIAALTIAGYANAKPRPDDLRPAEQMYAVTDRRVIVAAGENDRSSVFRSGAAFVDLRPNGSVFDVHIFSSVDELDVCLRAIADGPAVEKLVIETLAAKQGPVS